MSYLCRRAIPGSALPGRYPAPDGPPCRGAGTAPANTALPFAVQPKPACRPTRPGKLSRSGQRLGLGLSHRNVVIRVRDRSIIMDALNPRACRHRRTACPHVRSQGQPTASRRLGNAHRHPVPAVAACQQRPRGHALLIDLSRVPNPARNRAKSAYSAITIGVATIFGSRRVTGLAIACHARSALLHSGDDRQVWP
jgi:hypothetical protein